MNSLTPQFKSELERELTQEAITLCQKARQRLLLQVESYLLNECPNHYKFKCSECEEECKYG